MAVRDFVDQYSALASSIGERIGVSPNILLGQWGLETGWGKSVIPGTNNLGNIKSFDGSGVAATDNMTGSSDNYRQYGDSAAFGDDFASLLERRYKGAIGVGSDAESYAKALKSGGYAEDPAYVKKLITAANMARDAGASDDGRMTGKGNGFDDYFVDSPRGAPKAPRAAISTDGFSNDYFLPETPSAPVSKAGLMSDTGNLLKSGVNQVASGLREAVRQIPVVGDSLVSGADAADKFVTGKTSDEILKGDNERIQGALSDKMRGALDKKWWNSETQSLGDAWTDPRAYAGGIIQSLPGTLLTMIPAGRLAKMAYEAKVATLGAEEAAKAAARTAMLAGGAGEGLLSAGQTAGDIREELAKLPQSVWDSSDAYKSLIASGMDDASAKAALTNDAATKGFLIAGVTTAMFGGQGDRVLALAMRGGVSGGIGKRIVKGVIGEGFLEEAPQSYTQEIAKNVGVQTVDPTRQTTEGAFNAALGGLAVGAVQGGGMNALLGRSAPGRTAKDAETLSEAATLPVTPVVTPEEIAAIPQAPAELSPREQRQQAVADKLYPLPAQRETASTAERQLEAINAINPLPEQRDGAIGVRQTPFTDAEIAAGVERAQAPARAIEEAYRLNEREQQDAAFQQAQQPQGATPLAFNDAAATPVIAQSSATPTAAAGGNAVPQVTLRSDGQPFATLKAAETSIKARGLSGAVAVSVKGGGFGIRMAAPASTPINVGQANESVNQRIASPVRDDGVQGNIAPTPNAPTQPQPSAQGNGTPTVAGNAMAAGLRGGSGTNLADAGKPQSDGAGIAELKNEIGWAEQGGRMIRAAGSDGTVNSETISRTKWIPKSDFWPNRPKQGGAITEAQASVAIDKAIAGQPLNARERRFVEYAAKFNADRTLSQPAPTQTEKTNETDISEAEYEHYKQTGEPGFGWMPGAETFADSLDANTIEQLDVLLNLPESTDERAAMRSMGFTEDEITETLGPDAAASAGTNQVPESAPAASESTPASREEAPPAAEVAHPFHAVVKALDAASEAVRSAIPQAEQLPNQGKLPAEFKAAIKATPGFVGYFVDVDNSGTMSKARDTLDDKPLGSYIIVRTGTGKHYAYVSTKVDRFGSATDAQETRRATSPEQLAEYITEIHNATNDAARPQLDLTNPTESKLRTDDAKQKRDAAEKAAKENAPSPEEFGLVGSNRAADVGAAAGQNALFQNTASYGNNAANENEAYATDLFGDPVPSAARAPRADSAKRPALRRDAQPKPALRDTERPDGEYLASTIVGASGERELGVSRILTAEHAAAATRYLYRSAVERFDAIVTDKNGKPLAVVGGFKGAPTQTAVYPSVVIAEAMRVPGAANIWLSHNHPSGSETLSHADIRLESTFSDALRGSGIQHMGLLAVAGDRRYSHVYDGNITKGESRGPGSATISVPVIERELADNRIDKVSVNAPDIAKQVARDFYEKSNGPGVILLDAQHKLLGWMAITPNMYGALRGKSGGLNAIYRALSHSGAVSGIIAHGGELDARIGDIERVTASQNIAAALSKVDVSPLDSINVKTGKSVAMIGDKVADGPLFSRSDTIEVDGQQRPRNNSNGKPIAATDEGIRNFWRWFAGSRVVDDQGRPLVVYHGTAKDFSKFDENFLYSGEGASQTGSGFYFTDNPESASGYSGQKDGSVVMPIYLSLQNPLSIDFALGEMQGADLKLTKALTRNVIMQAPNIRNVEESPLLNFGDIAYEGFNKVLQEAIDMYVGGNNIAALRNDFFGNDNAAWLTAFAKATGYDSAKTVTGIGDRHFVAWKPNQVKSALGNTGQFSPDNADIRFSREAPLWRSTLTEAIGKTSFAQAPADQWKAWLNANAAKLGVKKDEIEWSGVTDWLALQKGKVTRDQVREFLDENGVKVTETMLGGSDYESFVTRMMQKYGDEWATQLTDAEREQKFEAFEAGGSGDRTKYGSYQLPGGENYRELLLTLPSETGNKESLIRPLADATSAWRDAVEEFGAGNGNEPALRAERIRLSKAFDEASNKAKAEFKSSHWDQPNILAHIRFNERTDADGKRVLFLEELQSDWGQRGKKEGFDNQSKFADLIRQRDELPEGTPEYTALQDEINAMGRAGSYGVPNAPFVGKTEAWVSLALKRMIKYAVDNGFDRIAMVNGEQSAERYDLSKQVDSIEYRKHSRNEGYQISGIKDGTDVIRKSYLSEKDLEGMVGKDVAAKIINGEGRPVKQGYTSLSGVDLKVGGEGMKAFYDRIVPQVANDVLKKLGGGKMETVNFGAGSKWAIVNDRTGESQYWYDQANAEELAKSGAERFNRDAKVTGGDTFTAKPVDKSSEAISGQPGFDITDKMREHAAQGMPLFRRDEQQPTATNTHAADVIAKAAKTVNIPLDVYATPQEASAKLGIDIPSDARGLFYKGRAALISSNITSPRMAEFVLWHELLHAGITLVAPRYGNEYNRIMQDLAMRNTNIIKAARDWRNSYGEETIQRSMDAGLSREQADKRMRLMAIEEALADLAGSNAEIKGWSQFVAKLQALLRSMGGFFDNLADWIEGKTQAETLQLIARTRDAITSQDLQITTQVPAFAREEEDSAFQRAYHGTPHKFDKFSLDKVGTGEGAQAYGYGLYFASKREIAEHYRNALGRPDSAGLSRAQDLAAWAYSMQSPYAGDAMEHLNNEIARMEKYGKFNDKVRRSDYEEAKRIIANGQAVTNGKLYQVDIPEDSEMLHWDKPLSEQSDEVKALANKYDYPLSRTGGDFQKWASSASGGLTINIRGPKDRAGLEKQASDLFKKNGIRGIKYLDGGSRNAGDGSYNYVVFDDKDVNIEAVHSRTDTIEVDGKARSRSNSNGKPIAATDEGLRNFWRWFADSRVVDEQGRPLVVYHGTTSSETIDSFSIEKAGTKTDTGWMGRGFYFGSSAAADAYAGYSALDSDQVQPNAAIYPAYLSLKNPAMLIDTERNDGQRFLVRELLDLPDSATAKEVSDALSERGYDGAIYQRFSPYGTGYKEYAVFTPNQIKSAVGNAGAFSPDNADIRFSRNEQTTSQDGDVAFSRTGSGDIFDKNATAAQSTYNGTEAVQGMGMSVKNVMRQTANIARDKRGAALSFLGGRQIADIYSKDVPELPKYNEILQRMQAEQNEGSAVADSIIEKWRVINRKRPEVATQLSSLMHDSTLAQVDPDVSADNAELRKRWINLPQEAKDIYREARDAYVAHFEKVKAELIDRVERSALDTSAKNRTLASMREEFTKAMKGVYFPLARFGDYMVVVKDKAGVTQAVSMAETTNQAQALRAELLRAYPDYVVGAIQKKKEFNAERDGVSRGFMKDLVALISEEPDAQTRDSQLDAINQLWLSSLPDLSWAKSGIHRKGTPGYSNDAMRAFARNMFHGGYHLAKLRYGDRLGDTLAQMQETIDNKVRSNPEYSNVVAQSVVDEMNARHKHVMNPQNTPVANALTGLGFMWHMGLSPASAVVNLSQTALVAYPMLASKFGFGKAATMLLSLSADAVKGKNDLLSQLQGAEKDAYDRAVREGLIDVTMAHDLAGVSQGKSGEFNEKQQRVMRVASVMFHEAEKFNRGVTFMSAYRLAVQSGVSDPYKLAHDLTFDSHFDYSSQNRPRVMQGPTARVILLFKQYGQNMIYTLSRNTFKALQGDREAQKTLAGLLAMHGMFAGALGLPLMTTLLAAASAIGGSDDEPWDAQVALRNYLADVFGKDIGEVLAHGVFRAPGIKDAIGADISGRVGLDSMLIRMPQETLEGKKYYQALLETIAGPVFGIGGNIANGMQTMAQGNTLRGIEEMLPKSIKDPLKAYRYEQDGIQDKTGITIVDETTIPEEVAQFLGFSPARGMEGFEGKSAIKNQETLLTQRRRQLMQRYGKDAEEGDTADSLTAIQRWNIANPTMAIKGQDLLRSMREKAKRQAEAENGAYLSKKRRGLAELGEFANAE